MKVSQLIKELQVAKAAMGDVEIRFDADHPEVLVDVGENEIGGVIQMGKQHTGYLLIASPNAVEAL